MKTLFEMNDISKEAVAALLGMAPGAGMNNALREIESPGEDFTIGDATDAYLKYMGSKYRVIEIEVRSVYGVFTTYPVNEAAKLLAEIAGTKTLTDKTLYLAEKLGFSIEEVTPARTKYGMKEAA